MRQPWMMTCSDGATYMAGEGKPHPRGHGAFTRKLTTFVRERKTVSLAQALHSMTGLLGPGLLARRAAASSPKARTPTSSSSIPAALRDEATYQEPHRHASGMHCVLVNGTVAIDEGRPTHALAGVSLRREARTVLTVDLPDSLQAAIDGELARPAGGCARRGRRRRSPRRTRTAGRPPSPTTPGTRRISRCGCRRRTRPCARRSRGCPPTCSMASEACWTSARVRAPRHGPPSLPVPSLVDGTQVDRSRGVARDRRAPRRGGARGPPRRPRRNAWRDVASMREWPAADLVIGAYALAELSPRARARLVAAAWRATRAIAGAGRAGHAGRLRAHPRRRAPRCSRRARRIVAPCPHEGPCPMRTGARTGRLVPFRGAGAAHAPSSAAEGRQARLRGREVRVPRGVEGVRSRSRPQARVLRHPRIEKGRIALTLCTPDGAERKVVTRRDASWHAARKAELGRCLAHRPGVRPVLAALARGRDDASSSACT